MKPSRLILPIDMAAIIASSLLAPGCSFIGAGIGAIVDSGAPDSVSVSSWEIDAVSSKDEVSVLLNDGTEYHNATLRVIQDSLPAYQTIFGGYVATHSAALTYPKPLDSVVVTAVTGTAYPAVLLAYDYGWIWVERGSGRTLNIRYASIRSLDFKGAKWTGDELLHAVDSSRFPLRSSIVIADKLSGAPHCTVSPLDIQSVRYAESKHGLLTGFLVGAAVDVTVLITAVSESKTTHTTGKAGGSCPFVYSYDGMEYVLDSETFSGAILSALQRTDCDNLEHLADIDGTARLKIANKLSEIQYVDQLRVLAVDHPAGTEIIARSEREVCSISDPQAPAAATDLAGHVVTPLVSGRDSLSWISNPAGRDPGNAASVRDALLVRFQRPTGARQAKLLFSLQNTRWAIEMEAQLLRLQGSNLNRWYNAMNASPDLREGFADAVKREAMLSVQLWDGRSWKTVDYVPFVGPFVEKSHVVSVDLQGTPEDEIRVRVESTAGLWMVNSVQADFSPAVPVQVSEATLTSAVDAKGSDLRELLSGIDESYYILKNGDEAELTYSLPPRKEGMARTFVLLSTGYYTVDVPAAGTPQLDLVRWIGNEEGAFGRYSTRLFNTWLNNELAVRDRTVDSAATK